MYTVKNTFYLTPSGGLGTVVDLGFGWGGCLHTLKGNESYLFYVWGDFSGDVPFFETTGPRVKLKSN